VEELDEGFLKKFSFMSAGDVSPMQAVIGSITAQEVVKVSQLVFSPNLAAPDWEG